MSQKLKSIETKLNFDCKTTGNLIASGFRVNENRLNPKVEAVSS